MSIPAATKAQRQRFDAIKSIGCIACHLDGYRSAPNTIDVHHMTVAGRRISHDATVGLCPAHHKRSTATLGWRACVLIGPSWHEQRREFRERYGSDDELLAMQNELIREGAIKW